MKRTRAAAVVLVGVVVLVGLGTVAYGFASSVTGRRRARASP